MEAKVPLNRHSINNKIYEEFAEFHIVRKSREKMIVTRSWTKSLLLDLIMESFEDRGMMVSLQ